MRTHRWPLGIVFLNQSIPRIFRGPAFFSGFFYYSCQNKYGSLCIITIFLFVKLDIPPFVLHHDMRVNPDNYRQNYCQPQLPRLTESVATGWTQGEL